MTEIGAFFNFAGKIITTNLIVIACYSRVSIATNPATVTMRAAASSPGTIYSFAAGWLYFLTPTKRY